MTARRELTDEEARRLRRLAEAADLFGPDHIGEDFTPMDGILETLRFRPVAGGRAAVLVTSGNRSFEDHDARRGLLGLLKTIESRSFKGSPECPTESALSATPPPWAAMRQLED